MEFCVLNFPHLLNHCHYTHWAPVLPSSITVKIPCPEPPHPVAKSVYFWMHFGGFLNGWSSLYERSCQERQKIITTLHTFLTLWISIVFARTLDEDMLMIKVRTEQDKSPKKWSLEFDLTKIKMFPGEDKWWRLVSRCWSFIVVSHGVIY